MNAKAKKQPVERKLDNSVSLFVSLYLVVLAFFILLNSISKVQQQKTAQVLESLTETFSDTRVDKIMPYIEKSSSFGSQVSTDTYFAPVGRLAKEMLSITDADIVETGNTMTLKIPVNAFFLNNSHEIQGKQQAFMNTLADELTKMGEGAVVNVEFSIGVLIASRMDASQQELQLNVNRAGNFARVITSMGVDDRGVYVGLMPQNDPGVIQMTFTVREKPTTKQEPL